MKLRNLAAATTMTTTARRLAVIAASSAVLTSCGGGLPETGYVLIRYAGGTGGSVPALRAYFIEKDASSNRIGCTEILGLANEAVEARKAKGEAHLVNYECVTVHEAKERGFK